MIKNLLKFLVVVGVLSFQSLDAQTITGTVTDGNGVPLPGVNIVEKDTNNGAATDFDGNYSISVSNSSAVLIFSSIGFATQEIALDGRTTVNVTMAEDASQLDEVVVTALGIKRERKSLGYAVQEIKAESVVQAREPNVVNALSGKVTGLNVVRGSNGPGGSSKIIIRGFGSLTGDNQPLIVVDGVPYSNFTGGAADFWNPRADFGNGLGDINPEDIESLTVLKGASAAALYGNRAGNGVILITTKTGQASPGLGVSYSLTTGFQSIFMTPDLQTSFGQGVEGIFDPLAGSSWGPKIEGQTVTDYKGDSVTLRHYNNIDNYYGSGFSQTHNVSFQNQVSDATSLYSSASYLDDDSNIPGATFERLNLTTRSLTNLGSNKNWTIDAKVQYNRTTARNRPFNGVNSNNNYNTILTFPNTIDIRDFSDGADEFGNQTWYDTATTQVNPYWAREFDIRTDSRDRFVLTGSVKHQVTDWLSVEVKGGADLYTFNEENTLYAGGPNSPTGRYSLGKRTFIEQNYSVLAVASKDNLFGKLGGMVTLGGNLMSQETSSINSNSGQLVVPNLFSLNNGVNPPSTGQGFSRRKTNSAFGSIQANYDGYLFLEVTGRNDWTSTLSKENRSFFYSSINTSVVVSDLITKSGGELPSWLTFAKVRASFAEVGNDLSPYQLVNAYNIGNDPFGNTTATTGSTLFDPSVVNELIESKEVGIEGRLFNNRVGFDLAWYKTNNTNQLIPIPLDPQSGFTRKIVNAGNIQNKGIELSLNGSILDNPEGLSWDLTVNYSNNDNKVLELTDDVSTFNLGGFDSVNISADPGEDYGVIKGTSYRRVEDENSPLFGRIVVDGDGLPVTNPTPIILGSQQPDALLGITNSFNYKGWNFAFQIDASIGGEIFSGTNVFLQRSGLGADTVVNGERPAVIFEGAVDDGAGNFSENTITVDPEDLYNAISRRSGNLGINEAYVYDATHVRLRNIVLSYDFSPAMLKNLPFQSLRMGVSANNVWMIDHNLNGVDPESVLATGTNAIGFENLSSPTNRTIFFNLTAKF
jgi:TonB-linked SusC/RagA family outer membrane protein